MIDTLKYTRKLTESLQHTGVALGLFSEVLDNVCKELKVSEAMHCAEQSIICIDKIQKVITEEAEILHQGDLKEQSGIDEELDMIKNIASKYDLKLCEGISPEAELV